MSTLFFGGIGQYYFDGNGQLWNDENVPFVNTISRVRRGSDGGMSEVAIGSMPALLGASAEFIITPDVPQLEGGILDLDALSGDTVLAGHIVGGITSSAANIFFVNTGTQSDASTRVFRVLLVRDITTGVPTSDTALPTLRAWTGDAAHLVVETNVTEAGLAELVLIDSSGRQVRTLFAARMPAGVQRFHSPLKDLAAGRYVVELRINGQRWSANYVR
jgi:hypothetical protein